MSKQIYWAVIRNRKGSRMWPQRFHFRYEDAKNEAWRWNGKIPKSELKNPEYVVVRYLLETKDMVHYDIYKHETKRI